MPRTLAFDKLPAWMKKDSRIQTGYREELRTVAKCFWSLFYLHNEFVNVWSHLLPAIVYAIILVKEARFALVNNYDSKVSSELNAVRFYVGTSFLLMIFSSTYHLFSCHSERVAKGVLKLDYMGIVLNVSATSITSSWFGFRKQAHWANMYITLTLALSVIIVFMFLKPKADGSKAAVWRALIIAGLMATGYTPLMHTYLISGIEGLQYFPWRAAVKMMSIDIVGVVFYITRFPEKRFPRTFDIWGASHQIFHVTVVVGRVVYLRGLRDLVGMAI